ncbi:unnamed protein product [Arctia plantaginis]|uniref:Peroxisome biogenesis factor 2 n=1 Tax=Arctia plantaginis TaxID=874455 RepID=A0A8S1AE23_ARCPL|nr:unnamed protein product [Arctia plantaginis]
MSISYIPRVTQLDAVQLDNQVEELFKQLFFQATKFIKPRLLQPVLPELELLIRTWIFKYSVVNQKSTFGHQMLSLKYRPDNFVKIIDFMLGLHLTADNLTREDLTDFSWTRELLWHNFIELIGTTIALINIFGLKRKLSSLLKYVWWRKHVRSSVAGNKATMTINTVCACCGNNPVLPHTMGCSHIFCYYCLSANKIADQEFACPKCYYNGKEINKFVMT